LERCRDGSHFQEESGVKGRATGTSIEPNHERVTYQWKSWFKQPKHEFTLIFRNVRGDTDETSMHFAIECVKDRIDLREAFHQKLM
jgi:hypothetical protein